VANKLVAIPLKKVRFVIIVQRIFIKIRLNRLLEKKYQKQELIFIKKEANRGIME